MKTLRDFKPAIDSFETLLRAKGYRGRFELRSKRQPQPLHFHSLRESLEYHIAQNILSDVPVTRCELSTYAEHLSVTNFKKCVFAIDYHQDGGFRVHALTIESAQPTAHQHRVLESNEQLPGRQAVLAQFPRVPLWRKICKRFGVPVLSFLLLSVTSPAPAQIFNQKGGMIRNNIQQIALLRSYMAFVREGYRVVSQGVSTVRHLKNGEFNLHRDFFGSLSAVNPRIARYARVADILAAQAAMMSDCRSSTQRIRATGSFSPQELELLSKVFSSLLEQSYQNLSQLSELTTQGRLQLSDDERLKRIDALWAEVQQQRLFCRRLNRQVQALGALRGLDQQETSELQILHLQKNSSHE